MTQRAKTMLTYVVFVPRGDESDALELSNVQLEVTRPRIQAVFSSMDHRSLDKALREGVSLEDVFFIQHNHPFSSIDWIWIAGGGSSIYAREVIRLAFSERYQISVENSSPQRSVLYRYVHMWENWKDLQTFKAKNKAS